MVTCPPETAFGFRSTGKIPANSTLKFDIELVDFVDQPKYLKKMHLDIKEPGVGPNIYKKSNILVWFEAYHKDPTRWDKEFVVIPGNYHANPL